jgi:hypothetical protein
MEKTRLPTLATSTQYRKRRTNKSNLTKEIKRILRKKKKQNSFGVDEMILDVENSKTTNNC